MTTHNGHSRSINFRSSCDLLNKFYSSIITAPSRLCHMQFYRKRSQYASPDNKHGQDSGDLTNNLIMRLPSQLGSTYRYAYLNTISTHAKQEPQIDKSSCSFSCIRLPTKFYLSYFLLFSSISMKPNDVCLLLSHSLNSHRQHHLSRKQFNNQKPEIEIMESRKILFKPTSVRWNPQNYLTTRDTCILTTILCAHHSSFNFTYFIFQTTHYNLLISITNVTSSRKTLNNMTRHFS
jgi:hypothetical protein